MPVYVYRNLTTGETFDLEQRITEPALSAHPETGDPVKRLIQPVGIAFKGSGFYVTDSRSASAKASKAAADSKSNTTPSKEGSSSSSKDGGNGGGNGAKTDTSKTKSSKSESSKAKAE